MKTEDILSEITHCIHTQDPLAEAFLFGSRARGDHRPDSDWDILILVDDSKVSIEVEDKFRDKLYDLELEIGQSVSIFVYPKEYWNKVLGYTPFYKNVLREGVKLAKLT